jgi:hypothetical protein
MIAYEDGAGLVGQNAGFGSTEAQQQRRGDAYLADDILGGWGGLWEMPPVRPKSPMMSTAYM